MSEITQNTDTFLNFKGGVIKMFTVANDKSKNYKGYFSQSSIVK